MITPKTRMLEDEELRVLLGAIVHAQPRIVRGPVVPARNTEPLSEADPDWLSEWREREFQEAKASARALAIGILLVTAVVVVVGGCCAWLLK